jgi:hypothetical protein
MTPHPGTSTANEQASLSRRAFVAIAASAAWVLATTGGVVAWIVTQVRTQQPVAEGELRAGFVPGALPDDPADAAWTSRPPVTVALLPQNMTTPMLEEQTIREIRLRALHNSERLAFHLEWEDEDVDELDAMATFRDSVAVQLPLNPDGTTPVTMGGAGRPVHILHWKASWQRQVEHGPREVRDAFPHAVNEVTPEAMMGEEAARVYYPALNVGNLAAARVRESAVEELVAEGFGTLTTQDEQRARGRGEMADAHWRVVVDLPMRGGDTQPTLRPGASTPVAVAAWDGGRGNRGARKHWSNWLTLDLESA